MLEGLELKLGYLQYRDGNVNEALKCISKYFDRNFYYNLKLDEDPFYRTLAKHIFVSVILNKYSTNIEIKEDDLGYLFSSIDEVNKSIKEFCLEFSNNTNISFIPYLQKSTPKMICSSLDIIQTCLKNNIK